MQVLQGNIVKTVKTAANKMGLQINEDKKEYMEVRRRRDERQTDDILKVGFNSFKKYPSSNTRTQ